MLAHCNHLDTMGSGDDTADSGGVARMRMMFSSWGQKLSASSEILTLCRAKSPVAATRCSKCEGQRERTIGPTRSFGAVSLHYVAVNIGAMQEIADTEEGTEEAKDPSKEGVLNKGPEMVKEPEME